MPDTPIEGSARLRRHVETLAQSPRLPGTPAHKAAREYIASHLEDLQFSVREDMFELMGHKGVNVITEPWPDDPELPLLIVGAHYDTRPKTPGADDNASAVAGLLELTRFVSLLRTWEMLELRCRLQLVAFDLEERQGERDRIGLFSKGDSLYGSKHLSRKLDLAGEKVLGMISLEMLGYATENPSKIPLHLRFLTPFKKFPEKENFIGVVGNWNSKKFLNSVVHSMQSVPGLPVETLTVPGKGWLLPNTRRSDHSSFWDREMKALMITDTANFRNPNYHEPTDTPDTLNYPFLTKVTQGVCRAIGKILVSGI